MFPVSPRRFAKFRKMGYEPDEIYHSEFITRTHFLHGDARERMLNPKNNILKFPKEDVYHDKLETAMCVLSRKMRESIRRRKELGIPVPDNSKMTDVEKIWDYFDNPTYIFMHADDYSMCGKNMQRIPMSKRVGQKVVTVEEPDGTTRVYEEERNPDPDCWEIGWPYYSEKTEDDGKYYKWALGEGTNNRGESVMKRFFEIEEDVIEDRLEREVSGSSHHFSFGEYDIKKRRVVRWKRVPKDKPRKRVGDLPSWLDVEDLYKKAMDPNRNSEFEFLKETEAFRPAFRTVEEKLDPKILGTRHARKWPMEGLW